MRAQLICIYLAIISIITPAMSSSGCFPTEKCSCFQSNEYEYQCPPDEFQINIKALPEKYVNMYCENLTSYDLDQFPDIDAMDADSFSMSYCPMPNISFSSILNKFNMKHVKRLSFEPNDFENVTVSKGIFEGLNDLEALTITYSTLTIEDDFLSNTPNLLQLSLWKNNIEELGYIFNYTSELKYLDLSRNGIRSLPDRVFYNLHNLQKLHLWSNNLRMLNKEMFTGLQKLALLELSMNRISTVSENAFSELKSLINISLKNNELGYIGSKIFQNNPVLESVRLGSNPNLNLSDYVFANLTSLKHVNIDDSNLIEIPQHLFEDSFNIEDISISKNKLSFLPGNVFKNLKVLKKINLSFNELSSLPDEIFATLINLTEIFLQNNVLETLNNFVFKDLSQLKILNLEHNQIAVVESKAFSSLKNLRVINLAFNKWNNTLPSKGGNETLSSILQFYYNPLNACVDLEDIDLRSNLLYKLPDDLIQSKVNLKKLNLSGNFIDTVRITDFVGVSHYTIEIDLSRNNLTHVDFTSAEALAEINSGSDNDANTVLILDHNKIQCDCYIYDLVRYNSMMLTPVIYDKFEIRQNNFTCKNFENSTVKELKPNNISCVVEPDMGCPGTCDCQWKPFDQSVVIDCSYRNLTIAPVILYKAFEENHLNLGFVYNQTVVNLEGNRLVVGPKEELGYENVTRLNLVDNRLSNLTWIPPHIEVLQLDQNSIELLDANIITVLENTTSLQKLTLSSNPWKCDCSAASLQRFLMQYFQKVDSNSVICLGTQEPLVNLKDLCQLPTGIIVSVTVILFSVLIVVTLLAVYYRYEQEIKVYLYAKNIFLWFVTEEDIDKDKTYDVFVSFSHKDEDFVINKLLPALEEGPRPFKVCVHIRDWIPGEFITKQVIDSVQDSKRTLVVLSNNFVESEWGKMEFRTAHAQALSDGRARVIVVIYGDLNEDLLDNEIKTYFKTNTYVKWGDPWFWRKLKYALPHSKRSIYHSNQNVMLKIDEKFDSMSKSNNVSSSTLSLDPSLLENNEHNFNNTRLIIVPDGEAPLLNR